MKTTSAAVGTGNGNVTVDASHLTAAEFDKILSFYWEKACTGHVNPIKYLEMQNLKGLSEDSVE